MPTRVLVVDDHEGIRAFITGALDDAGYETATAGDGHEATKLLEAEGYDVMLTDLKMPRMDGMGLLAQAKKLAPEMPIILLTAHGTIVNAVEAMKLGAFDYLTKPLEGPEQLRLAVRRALEHRMLHLTSHGVSDDSMVAEDPKMRQALNLVSRVAPTDTTVLLLGESGTGKEVAAREIHRRSMRSDAPFIAVNCAAVSPQLIESEMFGHEKGAFTGASEQHLGRFETANRGTLFLDEVGDLPLELQAKLLRVLQERRFERVGGTETIKVDVRVIAATNRKLEELIAAGMFREDLYHRLYVFPIELPPLRRRPGDVLPLAERLLEAIAGRLGRQGLQLTEAARTILLAQDWPGNVRELGNALERAAIMADGEIIDVDHLILSDDGPQTKASKTVLDGTLKEIEQEAIKKALARTDGHRKKAAEILGIGLRTLYSKIKEYGLD
jgi:two-component system, NtrC family, response regulator AtoC